MISISQTGFGRGVRLVYSLFYAYLGQYNSMQSAKRHIRFSCFLYNYKI